MQSLQKIIVTRLQWLAILLLVLVLPVTAVLQVTMLQNQARENAQAAFQQISHILEENTRDLDAVTDAYRQTCLRNAEAIAYMIQHQPEILGDIEEFRKIARMLEVDEIHIFDTTGRIFTGSHPEYYNYTFETGEQIGFFKPLLQDKSLRLCQDITPNTAEGKLVQYSALWSENQEFIVQVGMYPETILEYTEKNTLSYIFSLLQGNVGVVLYAVDSETGEILGSTTGNDNGRNIEELGLSMANMDHYRIGATARVKGVERFCIFTDLNGTLIGYVIATDTLYSSLPSYLLILVLCLGLIIFIIVSLMWRSTKLYIIQGIDRINGSLSAIADGNLEERVYVHSSREFSRLSDHINHMVQSLLDTTDKISFILDHTNLRIGVYEYSTKMKTVRFTEHIPEILGWDSETLVRFSSNRQQLRAYIESILKNPLPGEKNTFRLDTPRETYIKLEELVNGSDTLGIVIDVTDTIHTRRRIEQERDMDLLTGLYNRRAMDRELAAIFQGDPGCGALIMVDADSLKYVNDVYGHIVGDQYLKKLAQALGSFGNARRLAARQGGDEFVLLLYGYSTEEAILRDLDAVRRLSNDLWIYLEDGSSIPVRFSFGYVMIQGRTDFTAMLSEADGHMYTVKRKRKRALSEPIPF